MKISVIQFWLLITLLASTVTASHRTRSIVDPKLTNTISLSRVFPTERNPSVTFDSSIIASPVLDVSQDQALIILPVSNGQIAALDSKSGRLVWDVHVPTSGNQSAQLISTPVKVNNKLVVLYQCVENGIRTSHRLAVLDLQQKQWDTTFPILELSAEVMAADGVSTVNFNPPTAFSHSSVKHANKPGFDWGLIYAAFGNSGDTQPYHGWLFEIDLDAWHQHGSSQAISHVLLTTPEAECPVTMEYGNQEMICGGGLWTPAGPQLYPTEGNAQRFELFIATGNGQIDLDRHDYANTVMRLQPGLNFDAGCDKQLCQNFNPGQPDQACMASCKNLFIPRPAEGNPPLKPSNKECDNKSFWECLAWMDYDLGASAPLKFTLKNGQSVLIQAGKDGAVYLIDANHLGTQYDRLPIVALCGTPTDLCKASWMGMIVTQPVLTYIEDAPVVIVPTFVPDQSHAAGVVALKVIEEEGKPKLMRFWQFPNPSTNKAIQTFRNHPSLPVITTTGSNNHTVVWIIDIATHGTLYGIRVLDGAVVAEQTLLGAGRQLATPLIYNETLYLPSIMPTTGKSFVEAYRMESLQ
ncbi:MAG: hypothetical protein HOP23_01340 [Methylococcaceae bacterium]|nr:hypothetical protein [Methylococcaceae bacterium]